MTLNEIKQRVYAIKQCSDDIARKLLKQLPSITPEGAQYTFGAVRAALFDSEN